MELNKMQWDEAQFGELTNPTTDLERYFRDRDKVVPYVAPPSEIAQYKNAGDAAMDLAVSLGKPAVVLSVVAGTVWVLVSGVVMVVGAMMAFISANAVWIGGIGVCTVFVFVSLAAFFRSDDNEPQSRRQSSPAQNINVTVNVAGQNVTSNQK